MPLLKWSRPSTISGFIMPISVDSVKRRSDGTFPHVLEERREVVHPTVADVNSATAIELPAIVRRVVAARFHGLPRFVGRGWSSTAILRAVTVLFGVGISAASKFRTPFALGRILARQRRSAHGDLAPAVAANGPVLELGDMMRKSKDSQTPEASAREVDWSHMMIISYETGAVYG
jgi:hypothetical protein